MHKVRVRFAPSPTGPLHIGGARSALFNYLFAMNKGGDFILRIEDTDIERSRREYEIEIIDSLRWLGLNWTEGVDVGGENGPYRQTERPDIYEEYKQRLLESGQAYYCFCSEEELEAERQALTAKGETPRYMGKCRNLTEAEKQSRLEQGIKPTLRFQVPQNKIYVVDDMIRGRVSFDSDNMGDFIIVKSDGLPTYNFAVVIDDVLMGVTHVIRAEEHLSNTPRQLMIYDALNFKRPEFAHISLILGSDRQKMSKRHGATSLMQYRENGYLPEALFNFLALLGWSPEGEVEIMSRQEIIKRFSLARVAKSPAVFDVDKLNWINQQYIKNLNTSELGNMLRPFLEKSEYCAKIREMDDNTYQLLVKTFQERLICLKDIVREIEALFKKTDFSNEAREILQESTAPQVLEDFLQNIPDCTSPEDIKKYIKGITKKLQLKPKNVFMPLRCALSGEVHGPDLPSLICLWGKDEVVKRIKQARSCQGDS